MKIIPLASLLVFCSFLSIAQDITGTILEEKTNIPLVGVNIYVKNSNQGTTTNNKGGFILKNLIGINLSDTLYISHVGYRMEKITISDLNKNDHTIYLTLDIQNLKEVSIAANRLLQPRINYKKLASLKRGLYATGSLIINNKIYVLGGDFSFEENKAKEILFETGYGSSSTLIEQLERTNPEFSWQEFSGKLQIYDINKDSWETSDIEFQERAYHNLNLYNNKIYILGGKKLSKNRIYEYLDNEIEVFDLNQDTVLIDYINPHQAVNFASVTYDDNIIVLGGSTKKHKNGDKEYTNKAHLYNLSSGAWYELKDMPEPKEITGILVKNKIYLIGGFNLKPLNEIESYNLVTGEWNYEGKLFHDAERPAITSNDSIIYIFNDGVICTYNTVTKELNEYLISLNLKYAKIHYYNNKLYIIGGYYYNEFSINPSPELYCIDISEFEDTKIKNSAIF